MPYITSEERYTYTEHLDKIVDELEGDSEDDLGGHLNFCISYLLNRLFERRSRYVRINTLMGAIEGAKQEFYRAQAAPYEEKKRKDNGDA